MEGLEPPILDETWGLGRQTKGRGERRGSLHKVTDSSIAVSGAYEKFKLNISLPCKVLED